MLSDVIKIKCSWHFIIFGRFHYLQFKSKYQDKNIKQDVSFVFISSCIISSGRKNPHSTSHSIHNLSWLTVPVEAIMPLEITYFFGALSSGSFTHNPREPRNLSPDVISPPQTGKESLKLKGTRVHKRFNTRAESLE
ncbi:hypothetical protein CDAR_429831 [Caerostris darwini]|uniref:Uncharacterized protein n=1 Tax=Caerostris darwini TaxID=1538125 RepID=A0AAV4VTI3_9ARAC|nr:hypothetical protein CDAR_429831 [Caerostris darwini]